VPLPERAEVQEMLWKEVIGQNRFSTLFDDNTKIADYTNYRELI